MQSFCILNDIPFLFHVPQFFLSSSCSDSPFPHPLYALITRTHIFHSFSSPHDLKSVFLLCSRLSLSRHNHHLNVASNQPSTRPSSLPPSLPPNQSKPSSDQSCPWLDSPRRSIDLLPYICSRSETAGLRSARPCPARKGGGRRRRRRWASEAEHRALETYLPSFPPSLPPSLLPSLPPYLAVKTRDLTRPFTGRAGTPFVWLGLSQRHSTDQGEEGRREGGREEGRGGEGRGQNRSTHECNQSQKGASTLSTSFPPSLPS